jgi:cardiolipin synthase A/B
MCACRQTGETAGEPDAAGAPDTGVAPDAGEPEIDAGPDLACDPYLPRDPVPELFIGPDGVLSPVLEFIDAADETLDIMMYQFTVGSVVDALVIAHDRGVAIRVMLDANQTSNASARAELTAAGIQVQDAPAGFDYNHSKVLIADGQRAIVMSANLNGFSISSERNYGVVLVDRDDIHDLQAVFEADWSGAPLDLVCTRLIVSPVNSRERIIQMVNRAESTLELSVMYLSEAGVRTAVIERAHAGVAVRVLLADPAWIDSNTTTAATLGAEGIPVKFLETVELHAKLIIADGVAFVGSENLSYTSLTQNREVGVLVTEPGPAAAIAAQFEADWAAGVDP